MKMPTFCAGPKLSRRQMLQVGGAGMLGLSLPQLLAAQERRRPTHVETHADACILIFLNGGPSHLDMWDMKPQAPVEIRGEFSPIATSVPGVQFSEHLPRLARQMHRCTVVRSMNHSVNNAHAAAVYTGLTGHDRGEIGGGARPTDHPAIGSVAGLIRPVPSGTLPYVALPYITKEGAGGPPQPGFFGGWLGRNSDPLFVLRNPDAADFGMPELGLEADVPNGRLDGRRHLTDRLHRLPPSRQLQDMDDFQARAFDLLTSPVTQQAFRIDRESIHLRTNYGRNIYGQSLLLARRLIEAGTRVVCLSWAPDANATWDTHGGNFAKLKNELLPQLDSAVSSLLDDLHDRGMLQRTMVAIMGEFGRSPRINTNNGGRDHWNFCYSLMLAGGGFRGGYVHGASDRIGGRPSLNPVTPAEIVASIYYNLGIPADLELQDRLNRPYTLVPWGNPLRELLA